MRSDFEASFNKNAFLHIRQGKLEEERFVIPFLL